GFPQAIEEFFGQTAQFVGARSAFPGERKPGSNEGLRQLSNSLEAGKQIIVEKEDFVHSVSGVQVAKLGDDTCGRQSRPPAAVHHRISAKRALVRTTARRAVIQLTFALMPKIRLDLEEFVTRRR